MCQKQKFIPYLKITASKSNGQQRNPEFRDTIKFKPQNSFKNRSDPMHPCNKTRKTGPRKFKFQKH